MSAGGGLAAVVVNYRTPARTIEAVAALARSTLPPDPLVVIDNGGHDAATLAAALPSVQRIETPRNLGFAGGANVGLGAALAAGADAVVLVNSDAVVAPDCLALLRSAAATPTVGLAGPALLRGDAPDQVESLGIELSPRTGRFRLLGAGLPYVHDPAARPRTVDALAGTVLLIRRDVLERIGAFDASFFLYLEDVDLCLRARAAGFRSVCVPAARAWHAGRASAAGTDPGPLYYATRNHLRLAAGLPRRRLLRPAAILAANLAYALRGEAAPRARGLREVLWGAADYVRGRSGPG